MQKRTSGSSDRETFAEVQDNDHPFARLPQFTFAKVVRTFMFFIIKITSTWPAIQRDRLVTVTAASSWYGNDIALLSRPRAFYSTSQPPKNMQNVRPISTCYYMIFSCIWHTPSFFTPDEAAAQQTPNWIERKGSTTTVLSRWSTWRLYVCSPCHFRIRCAESRKFKILGSIKDGDIRTIFQPVFARLPCKLQHAIRLEMSRLCLLVSICLVLNLSWACDDTEEEEELLAGGREDPEDYYAYAYGFTPETWRALYQQPTPRARVPGDSGEFLVLRQKLIWSIWLFF